MCDFLYPPILQNESFYSYRIETKFYLIKVATSTSSLFWPDKMEHIHFSAYLMVFPLLKITKKNRKTTTHPRA